MCGRFYLPMFLFRVGLFTLMYMASLISLVMLFPSLPIILKFSIDDADNGVALVEMDRQDYI